MPGQQVWKGNRHWFSAAAIILGLISAIALTCPLAATSDPIDATNASLAGAEVVTTRVSVSSSGAQANGYSSFNSISADGRFVAFMSKASNLVPDDTNGTWDTFVYDRVTGQIRRVSTDSTGKQSQGDYVPVPSTDISADGRFVAFGSQANDLVPLDYIIAGGVYVKDLQTGQTTIVSVDSAGNPGEYQSDDPSISADGRYIAFMSVSSTLVPGDTNESADIFVHDRQTRQTTCVSVNSAGNQPQENYADSMSPEISADGRFVAFESNAPSLVNGDSNNSWDIFVHDRQTGQTTRVSVGSSGVQANNRSSMAAISGDGRYITFASAATNLASGDTNKKYDVFVHDNQTGVTRRISVSSTGEEGNDGSLASAISADGRYVVFDSYASNLVANDSNQKEDVFVHDLLNGTTTRVSVASSNTQGNDRSTRPDISADGQSVTFLSFATNLVDGDTNGDEDIFAHGPLLGSPPIANNDTYAVDQDNELQVSAPGVLLNDTDADGEPLTATLVDTVAHGTLSLQSNGAFVYSPQAGFNGTDGFTYRASDGNFDSEVAQVTIEVGQTYPDYLKAANGDAGDEFGYAIAIDGDTIVVGAPLEDSNGSSPGNNFGNDSGAAYVFVRDGAGWTQQAYLKASDPQILGWFGAAVAIDGDTIVVGEPGMYPPSYASELWYTGAAYVFVRNGSNWSQQARLTASNADFHDRFGWSVAIDGNTILVGAPGEGSANTDPKDNNAFQAGAAYLFIRDGTSWSQQQYLKASNVDAVDEFGFSVALEGDTAVVGAPGEDGYGNDESSDYWIDAGAAYAFTRNGTNWTQRQYLKHNNDGWMAGHLGKSASMDSNTIVLGSPTHANYYIGGTAEMYVNSGASWASQALLPTQPSLFHNRCWDFGKSVDVDGDTFVVGAFLSDLPQGSSLADSHGYLAALFTRSGTAWNSHSFLMAFNADEKDGFGNAVTLDGETIAVGAPWEDGNGDDPFDNSEADSGAAYVFYLPAEGNSNLTADNEAELNAAILAVNDAGAGVHTIQLTDDVTLTSDLLPFTNTQADLIILDGDGHTLDGADLYSLVQVAPGVTLEITDITLTNGLNDYGGAIANNGTVTLSSSTVSSSTALEGGGIWNGEDATLTVTGSAIAGNTATTSHGGGIANHGAATLVNTTLSGNSAFAAGGGMANLDEATATLHNVTLSDNEAGLEGGGGYAALGSSTSTLHASLVSGNRFTGGPDGQEVYRAAMATLNLDSHNLFGHDALTAAQALAGATAGDDDRTATSDGTHPAALAAVLAPALADNGGATLTHALPAGSPAIDVAPNAVCVAPPVNGVDQRGMARNVDGDGVLEGFDCDSGAVEYQVSLHLYLPVILGG